MKSSGKPDLGLIGYGRFGRLAAHHLRTRFRVTVADARRIRRGERGIRIGTIAEAAQQPYVVLAVPVNQLKAVLRKIVPHLQAGAIVMDVGAVKASPMEWMAQHLPKHVQFIGTHPLFGPDSARRSFRGHTIVLCPGRISRRSLQTFIRSLRSSGIRVVVTTPAQHDRCVAETLFLSQYVGRALGFLAGRAPEVQTPSSRKLLEVIEAANNDSEELLRDLFLYAPSARRAQRTFERSSKRLIQRLRRR